jgi:hypothetical protein
MTGWEAMAALDAGLRSRCVARLIEPERSYRLALKRDEHKEYVELRWLTAKAAEGVSPHGIVDFPVVPIAPEPRKKAAEGASR